MENQFVSGLSNEAELPKLVELVKERLLETKLPLTPKTDYAFISKFIRTRKYNVETAVASIQRYYDHIFRNLRRVEGIRPSNFRAAFDSNTVTIMRTRINGAICLLCTVKNWDTKKCTLRDLQLSSVFLLEEIITDVEIQKAGGMIIFDLAGLSFAHARQCTYGELRLIIYTALESMPTKIIGIHLLHAPTLFWPLYKIACKILPEKIRSRMHLHSNVESLHKQLDRSILPKTLGGLLEEHEAYDTEIRNRLLATDSCYEDYWNGDICKRPRRMSRKRSSIMMMQH